MGSVFKLIILSLYSTSSFKIITNGYKYSFFYIVFLIILLFKVWYGF